MISGRMRIDMGGIERSENVRGRKMEVPSMVILESLKCDEEMKRICEFERFNSHGNRLRWKRKFKVKELRFGGRR